MTPTPRCPYCNAVYTPNQVTRTCRVCGGALPKHASPNVAIARAAPAKPKAKSPSTALTASLVALGDRYGWICQLCFKPVDRNAAGKMAPSRDHIIPKSEGGTRAASNMQLAHKKCNTARGNRPLDPAKLARLRSERLGEMPMGWPEPKA